MERKTRLTEYFHSKYAPTPSFKVVNDHTGKYSEVLTPFHSVCTHTYKRIIIYTILDTEHARTIHTTYMRARATDAHVENGVKIGLAVEKESIIKKLNHKLEILPSCMVESCVQFHRDCVLA